LKLWRTISEDGNQVTLKKFSHLSLPTLRSSNEIEAGEVKLGCVIDIETSGLDRTKHSIIEIGVRQFYFDPTRGAIYGSGVGISQLQDLKGSLEPSITKITGLSHKDLKGQSINWPTIKNLLETSAIIVAHNARFDRPFIDQNIKYSERPVWACSMSQVDWLGFGFPTRNLQLLAAYHGFFCDSHRALNDADVLLQILSLEPKYLLQLYQRAHVLRVTLRLFGTAYESRHALKIAGFRWNPMDKSWTKAVMKSAIDEETDNLAAFYPNREPQYEVVEIPLSENFKAGRY
jgi:DNA polymerase-3 subunit epsilon